MGALVVVAGSRMVEGGGLVIPAHGLGLVDVQVMLVPAWKAAGVNDGTIGRDYSV